MHFRLHTLRVVCCNKHGAVRTIRNDYKIFQQKKTHNNNDNNDIKNISKRVCFFSF